MSHSFVSIFVHATFHIALGAANIPASKITQLHGYLNGILRENGVAGSDIGGTATHVHILFRLPTTILIGDLIGRVKSNSSRWLHHEGLRNFRWQAGYAGFSVSATGVESVRTYIRKQYEHHHKLTYREEVDFLFRQHGINNGGRFFEDTDNDFAS